MIVLRKLFSVNVFNNVDDFIRDDKTFIQPTLNIIKAVEMWDLEEGKYVDHWIKQMSVRLVMLKLIKYLDMSPQTALIGIEDNSNILRTILGTHEADYLISTYKSSKDFIDYVIYKLLNMTKQDDPNLPPKYFYSRFGSKDPNNLYYTSSDYIVFLKYVALCISGQLDPINYDRDYYQSINKIQRINVDWGKMLFKSPEVLRDVIVKCIENFRGIGLPKKVTYLNNKFYTL